MGKKSMIITIRIGNGHAGAAAVVVIIIIINIIIVVVVDVIHMNAYKQNVPRIIKYHCPY